MRRWTFFIIDITNHNVRSCTPGQRHWLVNFLWSWNGLIGVYIPRRGSRPGQRAVQDSIRKVMFRFDSCLLCLQVYQVLEFTHQACTSCPEVLVAGVFLSQISFKFFHFLVFKSFFGEVLWDYDTRLFSCKLTTDYAIRISNFGLCEFLG